MYGTLAALLQSSCKDTSKLSNEHTATSSILIEVAYVVFGFELRVLLLKWRAIVCNVVF